MSGQFFSGRRVKNENAGLLLLQCGIKGRKKSPRGNAIPLAVSGSNRRPDSVVLRGLMALWIKYRQRVQKGLPLQEPNGDEISRQTIMLDRDRASR